MPGDETNEESLAMITIAPPPRGRIARMACLQQSHTPFTLTSKTTSQSASSTSASGVTGPG